MDFLIFATFFPSYKENNLNIYGLIISVFKPVFAAFVSV